ncbi:MAG: FG-GAP-like repeat-containing protein [bacterium]
MRARPILVSLVILVTLGASLEVAKAQCAALAIGAPHDAAGAADAGAVNVLYGTEAGLSSFGDQIWHQNVTGIGGGSEAGDQFGYGLASGDFDGNLHSDLIVGVPGEVLSSTASAGAVNVIYGFATGLAYTGSQMWTQDSGGIPSDGYDEEFFGFADATGDFDGDGFDDLAVGVWHDWYPVEVGIGWDWIKAGVVNVLYGSADGLGSTGSQMWSQRSSGISDDIEEDDRFGFAVASGDFDGDGYADLAIGAPGEGWGSFGNIGQVHVLYGSAAGLSATGDQLFRQDDLNDGVSLGGDYFGWSLAAGDFNHDGRDDLAVGAPYDSDRVDDAGCVHVLYGTATGLITSNSQRWDQDSAGISSWAESGDRFAYSLATGDFDRDGYADLAIGVPDEDYATSEELVDAGLVQVIYGSASGLTSTGNLVLTQGTPGMAGEPGAGDEFGTSLAAGDFDCDNRVDLAIGVPGNPSGGNVDAGSVNVVYGSASGLTVTGSEEWTQNSSGVEGAPQAGDRFGERLAALPELTWIFVDDFEGGDTTDWTSAHGD